MPRWVPLMFLGMGAIFLAVGVIVGVFGARAARAEVARLEALSPLSAAAFEDQPSGTEALVEGVVSSRNRAIFRDFVAYLHERVEVDTDREGRRRETWSTRGRDTPRLLLDAGGLVTVGNESYSIVKGHTIWYDEATLGFNGETRDGSERYYGLVAGGPVTAIGTVVDGPEGNELNAATLFAGTREEYLASHRESATFQQIFGGIFGVVGLIFAVFGVVGVVRGVRGAARRVRGVRSVST